ncbi:hypothetical protein SO802_001129 [Lithocarpus litseifolius]|uniref:GH18 domain-containing protein n=1 Tax=Lithocarpus litseifolius TaxID=425828 RepID=A0AAW2DXH3_9ROSI
MKNLGSLFQEWHVATAQNKLLLSAVVYFAPNIDANTVYPKTLANDVDFLNVVCYDYGYGWPYPLSNGYPTLPDLNISGYEYTRSIPYPWPSLYGIEDTTKTAAHALLRNPADTNKSTNSGITSWIQNVLAKKLVMVAIGYGPGNDGLMEYDAILKYNNGNGAVEVPNDDTVSTYSYTGKYWIGYDSPSSIGMKVFANDHGLAGYFFWALGMDANCALADEGSF